MRILLRLLLVIALPTFTACNATDDHTGDGGNNDAGPDAAAAVDAAEQAVDAAGVDGGQNLCMGSDRIYTVDWPPLEQTQVQTTGFTQNVMAFKLAIPATFAPPLDPAHTGYISMVEVPGDLRTAREVSVSTSSCDFSTSAVTYQGYGGTSPAFSFAVDNPTGYLALGATVNFQPGVVYFVNVRNLNEGATTCPEPGSCDVLFNYKTPNSY
jgi:hypothetical protein